MALIRKANTPLEAKGLSLQTAYLAIDDFAKYDKKERIATYYVDIYAKKDQRDSKQNIVIKRATETCSGDDFDTYLGLDVIASNGDQFHKAYEHLVSIKHNILNPDFDSSKDESDTNLKEIEVLKYKDWESDEIA